MNTVKVRESQRVFSYHLSSFIFCHMWGCKHILSVELVPVPRSRAQLTVQIQNAGCSACAGVCSAAALIKHWHVCLIPLKPYFLITSLLARFPCIPPCILGSGDWDKQKTEVRETWMQFKTFRMYQQWHHWCPCACPLIKKQLCCTTRSQKLYRKPINILSLWFEYLYYICNWWLDGLWEEKNQSTSISANISSNVCWCAGPLTNYNASYFI